ncbi:MAG: hypothetical protein KF866_09830 [Phycisphaeraceae bacterium]|nr:hypothetical protein [Phycisphaeraceae bacterium]MCW5754798.1 hypothetical protein [Phycisphaeraceae bacterium]
MLKAPPEGGAPVTDMLPMGSLREVMEAFASFNTAEDGSGRKSGGMTILHGPGIVVEIPELDGKVMQVLVTVKDEDLAWSVLWRLSRKHGWRMMDPNTGQTFG